MKPHRPLSPSIKCAVSATAMLTFAGTSLAQNSTNLGALNNNSKNVVPPNSAPINAAPANALPTNGVPTNSAASANSGSSINVPPINSTLVSSGSSEADTSAIDIAGSASGSQDKGNSLQEHTTVIYRDAPLIEVLRHLCEEAKINHVISPRAAESSGSKSVSLKLIDVSYEVVLKTVLDSYQLGTVLENGILRIDTVDNIRKEQEDKRKIKDDRIRLEPTRPAIFQLNFVKADQAAPLIKSAMKSHSSVDTRFSVEPDMRTNRLIVEGVQEAQVRVKTLIESLDRRPQQVVIEARVIEAASALRRGIGINWGTRFNMSGTNGLSSGLLFPNSIIGNIGGAGEVVPALGAGLAAPQNMQLATSIGTINGMFNIDAILKAYESESQVNIIAQPSLLVQDNTKGEFSETINKNFVIPPPAGSTGAAAAVTTQFQLQLSVGVTPMIAADGSIELDIDVQRDSAEPGVSTSATLTSKVSRKAKTRLAVRHGETAVIGGLFTTTKTKSTSRIPFLGSLPIVGFFFRDSASITDRNELMILLTPRLVSNATGGAVATSTDLGGSPIAQPAPATPVYNPTSGGNDGINQGLNNNVGLDNMGQNSGTNTPKGSGSTNNLNNLNSLNSSSTTTPAPSSNDSGSTMSLNNAAPSNAAPSNVGADNNLNSLE